MTRALVGYTGFVGSNLYASGQFDAVYNSKNIEDAYGTNPDILYYAGMRAEKFLANTAPEKDKALVDDAICNIKKIAPKSLVLISTIDVYKNPVDVDEDSAIDTDGLHPYGYNRYQLEEWVKENIDKYLIVRLPGLFGQNIKKNFIYDYIHKIPSLLKAEKFNELECKCESLRQDTGLLTAHYKKQDNGFYKFTGCADKNEEKELKNLFDMLGFSALNFTDSRGQFQFYYLERLYDDIEIALNNDITLLNIATEPVKVSEVYNRLSGKEFVNEILDKSPVYDYKTKYDSLYGGANGYMQTKAQVLEQIEKFVSVASKG